MARSLVKACLQCSLDGYLINYLIKTLYNNPNSSILLFTPEQSTICTEVQKALLSMWCTQHANIKSVLPIIK